MTIYRLSDDCLTDSTIYCRFSDSKNKLLNDSIHDHLSGSTVNLLDGSSADLGLFAIEQRWFFIDTMDFVFG